MRKSIILTIETSSNEQVKVGLVIEGKEQITKRKLDKNRAQVVLPIIENILRDHKLTNSDLTEIQVHTGPGSFTGLRVGVSIANTLSAVLKIPINGQPLGTIVEPVYS